MKKLLALAVIGLLTAFATGCISTTSEWSWAPVMQATTPLGIGDTSVQPKNVGRSEAEGIILFFFGDSSIKAACEEGNITRIHHVDEKTLNVLGIYSRKETLVYGE